jgi:hydroxymethylpyrimidine/phosphomethylpyrimidine kinase
MIHHALSIAGSDSGGGAGIQADLKTFSALGVYGATVVTALTAQNTLTVRSIHDVPAAFIEEQLDAVFEDIRIDAVKIGMLSRREVIEAVARRLRSHRARNIVLDPVMVAKSGDKLLQEDAVASLRDVLLPLATLVTPNLPEAAVLCSLPTPRDGSQMSELVSPLLSLGAAWVLVKGGHLGGTHSDDLLAHQSGTWRFEAPRIATANTHGTGCTLSSAIAAFLARGYRVRDAVAAAKAYVSEAIAHADELSVGRGRGPVHHFHALWRRDAAREGER